MSKEKIMLPFSIYGHEDYYEPYNLLENQKLKDKFIKNIEKYIRTSFEYKTYIRFLKTEALLTQCVVMNMLPEEVSQRLKIEMHHCPLTLYDLVDIVLNKYLLLQQPYTALSIANEVMDAHFMNQIGIVPMTVTMHQMIHAGKNLVNAKDLFGNYRQFALQYETFIDESHIEKMDNVEALADEFVQSLRGNLLSIDQALYLEHDDEDENSVDLGETQIGEQKNTLDEMHQEMNED